MIPRNLLAFLLLMLYWLPILQAQGNRDQPGVVVQIDGQLRLKRPRWTVYAPVVFGKYLYAGDLLDLGTSSNAKVVCSDLTLHQVPTGIGGIPCPPSRSVLIWTNGTLINVMHYSKPVGDMINATRGSPSDGSLPLVLSPRRTKLISSHPILRWTPIKGVTAYKIVVRGNNLHWSTVVTSATEFVYPQDAPQLEVGVNYRLIVFNEERPGDEAGSGPDFSLLNPRDKTAVLEEQKHIENLGLSEGPTQFLIAHLYADRGLYAEAIERLEEVSSKFKMAAVRRLLGDLHVDVGLPRQAESDYRDSLELAKAENDLEGQMLSHQALAYVDEHALGNKEMASQNLKATIDLARRLGDASTASQIAKQLAALKTASSRE
jgi:hypothetical protein